MNKFKYFIELGILSLFLLISGSLVIYYTDFSFPIHSFIVLLSVMVLITSSTYLLVYISLRKSEKSRGAFLLAAVGSKFLLYLILILLFWIDGKNLSKEFIIAFFVLYLVLTFSLVRVLYKTLKIN